MVRLEIEKRILSWHICLGFPGNFEILVWSVAKHLKVDFVKLVKPLDCVNIHLRKIFSCEFFCTSTAAHMGF